VTDLELIRLAGKAWRGEMEKTAYNPFRPAINVISNAFKEQAGKGLFHAVDTTAPRILGGVAGGLMAPFMPAVRLAGKALALPVAAPIGAAAWAGKGVAKGVGSEAAHIWRSPKPGAKLALGGAVGFTVLAPPADVFRPREEVMGIALDQRRVAQGLPAPVQW